MEITINHLFIFLLLFTFITWAFMVWIITTLIKIIRWLPSIKKKPAEATKTAGTKEKPAEAKPQKQVKPKKRVCQKCGSSLEQIKFEGRTYFYCPNCKEQVES